MRPAEVASYHPSATVEGFNIAMADELEGSGPDHHATIMETRSPAVPVSSARVRLRTACRK